MPPNLPSATDPVAADPIVITVEQPKAPFKLPGLPPIGPKATKIIMTSAAVVILVSILTFGVFTYLANNSEFKLTHGLATPAPQAATGQTKSNQNLPGGGTAVGTGGTTGNNSPVVTLKAEPASVPVGGTSKLSWSVTNNPSSCTASDDWSGSKPASGSETTKALTAVQTYLFTITCKNATGTGFATVGVGAVEQGGSGGIDRPVVSLAANPTTLYTGDSSTLTWSATNSPTACTASGDWSGSKAGSGAASTGALAVAKTYTYKLTCTNSVGSGYATATVAVTTPPPDLPITSLASNPVGPVTPGTSITLTWSVTNAPSACTASGDWSGAKNTGGGSQAMGALQSIKSYSYTLTCSNSAGSTVDTAVVVVLPDPPVVSLSLAPSSIYVGSSANIIWSATNSPTACTASGDWTGAMGASGTLSTGTINTSGVYHFSLSCTNAGGTGYANNVPLTVTVPPVPVVSISASPISITSGSSANLTWSATNSPSSCTASGDWTGSKSASGTQSTGTLSTVKTYSYTLACTNAGGTGSATTTVNVTSGGGGVVAPVVTIAVSPTSIGTGSSSTISWSATNSPTACTASGSWSGAKSASGSSSTGTMNTAGSFIYTLACSNSAGSDTKSATLTVIAVPVVSISVSPTSINTGASSTITWSATGSPTACTASGSWSGSKAASGSVTTGTMNTAGSFTYTLACTNSGGTGSNSATLTVTNPAPVYCGGSTPCYGPTDLALHASVGNCWGWNLTRVINITGFRPSHPGGQRSGSLESTSATCNHDIRTILQGSAAIPGYTDSGGSTTHSHKSSTLSNTASQLASYLVGYYDATKP